MEPELKVCHCFCFTVDRKRCTICSELNLHALGFDCIQILCNQIGLIDGNLLEMHMRIYIKYQQSLTVTSHIFSSEQQWSLSSHNRGRNHVFKVGGPIPWSRVLLPFYRKIRQVYPIWCSRLHNHTVFIKKLRKNLGVRIPPTPQWQRPGSQRNSANMSN